MESISTDVSAAPRGKRLVPVNLEAAQADALRKLSIKTRISQQSFLREAVSLILEKYREPMK
jgi:hypothetical protein